MEFVPDSLNFDQISLKFENQERFLSFLSRIEKTELRKASKGLLSSYVNRNWESLGKEALYIQELGEMLHCLNCSKVAESLRLQCKLTQVNTKMIQKGVYSILTHIEAISNILREFVSISYKNTTQPENQKEEYEFLSYNSVLSKNIKMIKTNPPSMKSNLKLDTKQNSI